MTMRLPGFVLLIPIALFGAGCVTDYEPGTVTGGGGQAGELGGDRLRVIPEYEVSNGLMISYRLAQQPEMMPFLLDVLGSHDLFVLMPRSHGGREDPRLAGLIEGIERRGGVASRVHPFASRYAQSFRTGGSDAWFKEVWARDWGPLSAEVRERSSGSPAGIAYLDFNSATVSAYEDTAPRAFADFIGSRGGARYASLSMRNAAGNFMIGGDSHVMATKGPLFGKVREIEGRFRDRLQCRRASVMATMPHEVTGHIDLWGKFMSPHTVLVATLEPSQRERVPASRRAVFDDLRSYLDERAREIEGMGYRVIRVPNPVPVFRTNGKLMFRSYVNSLLLVSAKGGRTAYVPRYREPAVTLLGGVSVYPDGDWLRGYEATVSGIFGSAGYRVVFVPADTLITRDGSVHCVGMQVQVR